MEFEALKDFELYSKVSEDIIVKYEGKIPPGLKPMKFILSNLFYTFTTNLFLHLLFLLNLL